MRQASQIKSPKQLDQFPRPLRRCSGREALDRHGKVPGAAQHGVGAVRRRVLEQPGEPDPAEELGHGRMEFYPGEGAPKQ